MHIRDLAHLTAILSLTDASYTISEGEMLSVCVLLTGDLKRNVVGNIFTQDGTASGENGIYR